MQQTDFDRAWASYKAEHGFDQYLAAVHRQRNEQRVRRAKAHRRLLQPFRWWVERCMMRRAYHLLSRRRDVGIRIREQLRQASKVVVGHQPQIRNQLVDGYPRDRSQGDVCLWQPSEMPATPTNDSRSATLVAWLQEGEYDGFPATAVWHFPRATIYACDLPWHDDRHIYEIQITGHRSLEKQVEVEKLHAIYEQLLEDQL